MRNETVATLNGRPVVVMDSISLIVAKDAGAIIVCGSHGSAISGALAEGNESGAGRLQRRGRRQRDRPGSPRLPLSSTWALRRPPCRMSRRASATRSMRGRTASSAA